LEAEDSSRFTSPLESPSRLLFPEELLVFDLEPLLRTVDPAVLVEVAVDEIVAVPPPVIVEPVEEAVFVAVPVTSAEEVVTVDVPVIVALVEVILAEAALVVMLVSPVVVLVIIAVTVPVAVAESVRVAVVVTVTVTAPLVPVVHGHLAPAAVETLKEVDEAALCSQPAVHPQAEPTWIMG
jgi:hypothetical protein